MPPIGSLNTHAEQHFHRKSTFQAPYSKKKKNMTCWKGAKSIVDLAQTTVYFCGKESHIFSITSFWNMSSLNFAQKILFFNLHTIILIIIRICGNFYILLFSRKRLAALLSLSEESEPEERLFLIIECLVRPKWPVGFGFIDTTLLERVPFMELGKTELEVLEMDLLNTEN